MEEKERVRGNKGKEEIEEYDNDEEKVWNEEEEIENDKSLIARQKQKDRMEEEQGGGEYIRMEIDDPNNHSTGNKGMCGGKRRRR